MPLKANSFETPYNASVKSTCALPLPRVTPGHLFRFSVPGAGHLCTPGTTPGNLIREVAKPSKARAVKLRALFPIAMEAFVGEDMDFTSQ